MEKDYEFHEVANIFPLIEGKEFDELVEDIKQNGLMESIWLYDGKIIDGRNRYRACKKSEVKPTYRQFEGKDTELVAFILSLNLKRRHLDAGQKAFVALNVLDYFKKQAKERHDKLSGTRANAGEVTQKVGEGNRHEQEAKEQAGKLVGVNRQYIHEAERIKEKSPEKAKDIMSGKITFAKVVKENKQETRKADIIKQKEEIKKLPPVLGKFGVVVIDPPWAMEDTDNYDPEHRRGVTPYPTMTMDEIRKLKIPCEDDCIIWVWGIEKFLKETLEIIEHWGFTKKNTLIWDKVTFGLGGKYLRPRHEYCFLCIKGNPKIFGEGKGTVLNVQKTSHSTKPEEFYKLVEEICPHPRKLDYFARKPRKGWEVFGNEVN